MGQTYTPLASRPHIMIIDPATDQPELGAANGLALLAKVPVTYHQPALFGMASVLAEDMSSVCGLILLGSSASVHDRSAWQAALAAWLQPQLQRGLPTLAICFGHQFIANLFGGRVEYAFTDRSSYRDMRPITFAATSWMPAACGKVAVAHGEIVTSVPEAMRVIAWSTVAGDRFAEGLEHQELPIWTYQSHPEADVLFAQQQGIAGANFAVEDLSFGHLLMRHFMDYVVQSGHHAANARFEP